MRSAGKALIAFAVLTLGVAPTLSAQDAPQFQPIDVQARLMNAAEVGAIVAEQTKHLRTPRATDWLVISEASGSGSMKAIKEVVYLWLFVDASGAVTQARLDDRSARSAFGPIVLNAASKMRFEPAKFRGLPVAAWRELPVVIE